jgi:hypothetical protein
MEQRTAGRQRSLTGLLLLSLTRRLSVSLTQAFPVSVTPYDLDDDVVRGLDPRTHRSLQEEFSKEDGLPGAQTSLRSLRKADCYAPQ